MRIFILIFSLFLTSSIAFGQGPSITLKHGDKTKTISPKEGELFRIGRINMGDGSKDHTHIGGNLISKENDKFTIKPNWTQLHKKGENGIKTSNYKKNYPSDAELIIVDFDDVYAIEYQSKFSRNTRDASKFGFVASLVAGLVIGPLTSYDFEQKTFDVDNYGKWLATSGIAVSFTLITMRLGKKDTYFMKSTPSKERKIWTFN